METIVLCTIMLPLPMQTERHEKKGFVESELGEATPERGGRAKRFFNVTMAGKGILNQSLTALRQMSDGLTVVWEGQ